MTSPPTRHAIVGCGRVAPNHVDGFQALDGWEVGWACDRDGRAARELADRYGVSRTATSLADVLADPLVTSVSVAVDHAQHAELAEQALRAGRHVLVEKPLALSVADGERLVKLAADRGLVLGVVSQHRFDPPVVAVREWLREGLLGRLLFARVALEACRERAYYADSYWRGSWSGEGGSALVNQGYHCLDVARFLCGELRVHAAVAGREALGEVIETEDTLTALLVAGSAPVTLSVTVGSSTLWRARLEFVGTEGTVELSLEHPGTVHRVTGGEALCRRARAERRGWDTGEPPPGVGYYGISHRRQIADFAAAVVRGASPAVPPQAAVGTLRLLHDIYRAAGMPPSADRPGLRGIE